MRKLILFIATSLDGYIAGKSGEIDWLFSDQDYGFRKFYATVDTVVMGRKTWDLSLTFESRPFEVKRVIVFSRSQSRKDGRAEFISSDVAGFVRRFKRTKGGNIWLVGGADIVQPCMKSDLIDEYVISVHPVVLGGGIPLFRAPFPRTKLKLTRFKAFKSGLVQLTYKR